MMHRLLLNRPQQVGATRTLHHNCLLQYVPRTAWRKSLSSFSSFSSSPSSPFSPSFSPFSPTRLSVSPYTPAPTIPHQRSFSSHLSLPAVTIDVPDSESEWEAWFDRGIDRHGTGSLKRDKYTGDAARKDVIPLWVADMDFEAPPQVTQRLFNRAVGHRVYGYTKTSHHFNDPNQAVVSYMQREHGVRVEADWVVWMPGVVQGLHVVCKAIGNEGDTVMIQPPIYPPFSMAPGQNKKTIVRVEQQLDPQSNKWNIDFEGMEAAMTDHPKTKLLLFCNPQNPTGRVYSREELLKVGEFVLKHDLIICSDEIHCDLILNRELTHLPFMSLADELGAGITERTITMMAASKTYNLPGLACAFAIIPDKGLKRRFMHAMRGVITEVNCFGHQGTMAAFNESAEYRSNLLRYLDGNRQLVQRVLGDKCPEIKLHGMDATYLMWLDARGIFAGKEDKDKEKETETETETETEKDKGKGMEKEKEKEKEKDRRRQGRNSGAMESYSAKQNNDAHEDTDDDNHLALQNYERFFEDHGVGLTDGQAFGGKNGFMRLNFGCPRPVLRRGLERIVRAVESVRD